MSGYSRCWTPAAYSPQHAAEHQEGRGHVGGVQHGRGVGAHAGQERPHPAVLVLHGLPQPQLLQVGAGPFPEGQSLHQLRGVGRLAFVGRPLFDHDVCVWEATLERGQGLCLSSVAESEPKALLPQSRT